MLACELAADAAPATADQVLLQLYEQHDDFLRRMGRLLCGNAALADDLVQETWLRAWRGLASLRDSRAARGWLMVILRRELARHAVRRDNQHQALDSCGVEEQVDCVADQTLAVEQLLASLSEDERDLLLKHAVDGLTYQQLASHFGCNPNTIGVRLHRLRKRLST